MTTYRPIFFEQDWVLQRYSGWEKILASGDAILLKKKTGPFRRYLVLRMGEDEVFQGWLKTAGIVGVASEVIDHNFLESTDRPQAASLSGVSFTRLTGADRSLNVGTFVVNLEQTQEVLWERLGTKSRNMVRKCEETGFTVEFSTHDVGRYLDCFLNWYRPMAERNGLATPSRLLLGKMIEDQSAFLVVGRSKEKEPLLVNIVYVCSTIGFYLYGASADDFPTGAGQYMHWETIKYLKSRALRWYDLGGVPEDNPESGIYKFKKSLGGDHVSLGTEYVHRGKIIALARLISKKIRRFSRRFQR